MVHGGDGHADGVNICLDESVKVFGFDSDGPVAHPIDGGGELGDSFLEFFLLQVDDGHNDVPVHCDMKEHLSKGDFHRDGIPGLLL